MMAAGQGDNVLVNSHPLLAEPLEKLQLPRIKEKYAIADDDIADLMALFVLRGDLVILDRQVTVCRDSEGDKVIEAALAGPAPWVVTGDEDLLSFGTYDAASFVTSRTFLERLDEEVSGTNADERQTAETKRS